MARSSITFGAAVRLGSIALLVVVAAACSSDDQAALDPEIPECDQFGDMPCSLADVDSEVLAESDRVARVAWALLHEHGAATAAGLVEAHEDVVELAYDARTLRFRLAGGRSTWIMNTVVAGEPLLGAGSVNPGGHAEALPLAVNARPGSGVTGQEGEGKRALVLSPSHWEFAAYEDDPGDSFVEQIPARLLAERDWTRRGGRVDVRANTTPYEPMDREQWPENWWETYDSTQPVDAVDAGTLDGRVGFAQFSGWDDYDAVFVMTHGIQLCDGDDGEGQCRTGLMSGQGFPLAEDSRAVPDAVQERFRDAGMDLKYGGPRPADREMSQRCQDALAKAGDAPKEGAERDAWRALRPCGHQVGPPRADIVLRPEWFRKQYPEGLPDTIIVLAACGGMRHGDFDFLASGDGLVIGFTESVAFTAGQRVAAQTADMLAEGYDSDFILRFIRKAMSDEPVRMVHGDGRVVSLDEPTLSGGPEVTVIAPAGRALTNAGNAALRGRDIVAIRHPGGAELADGDTLELHEGPDGPVLPVVLEVIGVDDETEHPEDFELLVRVSGEDTGLRWTASRNAGDGVWQTVATPEPEAEIPVGADQLEQGTFELEIETSLPGGEISRWRYEDLQAGLKLELSSSFQLHAEAGGDSLVIDGELVGTAALTFDPGEKTWSGIADLEWARYDIDGMCGPGQAHIDSTFEVVHADIDLGAGDVEMVYRWNKAASDRNSVICMGHEIVAPPEALGVAPLIAAAGPDAVTTDEGLLADDWRLDEGDALLVYETEFERADANSRLSTQVRMELWPARAEPGTAGTGGR